MQRIQRYKVLCPFWHVKQVDDASMIPNVYIVNALAQEPEFSADAYTKLYIRKYSGL